MDTPQFSVYLKRNLSAEDFENLPNDLGLSQYKFSSLMNGTREWLLGEIIKLSKILKKDPWELIIQHGIGTKHISLDEMNNLVAEQGYKIGLLANDAA